MAIGALIFVIMCFGIVGPAIATENHEHGWYEYDLDFISYTHPNWLNDMIFVTDLVPHGFYPQYQGEGGEGLKVYGAFPDENLQAIALRLDSWHNVPENTPRYIFSVNQGPDPNNPINLFWDVKSDFDRNTWDPDVTPGEITYIPMVTLGDPQEGEFYKEFWAQKVFSNGHIDDYYAQVYVTYMGNPLNKQYRINADFAVVHTAEELPPQAPELPAGAVIPLLSLLGLGMIWLRKKAGK